MSIVTIFSALVCVVIVILLSATSQTQAQWSDGRATCYQDASGAACGYDVWKQGYGDETAALSAALFNDGQMCGACYEIMCVDSAFCLKGAGTIKITATNFCPKSAGPPGWCDPPQKHFGLSDKMFNKIAQYKAGVVPVKFLRIPCVKTGGIRFTVVPKTNPNWITILLHNVGGDGVVVDVKIKGSKTGWIQMQRLWGQNWNTGEPLMGQALSFQVTTSDRKTLVFWNVAPWNWQVGQTFEGKGNV